MKTIKSKAIIFILIMIAMISFSNISKAKEWDDNNLGQLKNSKVGDRIRLWGLNYDITGGNTPNLYCLQHGQKLADPLWIKYTVDEIIDIEGKVSTDSKGKKVTSKYNAQMLGILGSKKGQYEKQKAFWLFQNEWQQQVGKQHGIPSSFFNKNTAGSSTVTQEAKDYANTVKSTEIIDETNKDSIKVAEVERNGEKYYRIGPFKIDFSVDLDDVEVYNGNNAILPRAKVGSKEAISKVSNIKSGRNFFVYIPVSSNVKKVKKIRIVAKAEVRTAKMVFLKSPFNEYQHLAYVFPDSENKDIKLNIPIDIEIPPPGGDPEIDPPPDPPDPPDFPGDGVVKLIEDTSKPLEGITFGLKYWVPDNKEYTKFKREPLRSDSKYWGTVYYPCSHPIYGKDEDGNTIITGYQHSSDPSYEFIYSSQYRADHDEWLDWKENYDYYIKSQSEYVEKGVSNSNGVVSFSGRKNGTYSIYEIKSANPYFIVSDDKPAVVGYRLGDDVIIENPRTYLDIEGDVFIDEAPEGSKEDANGMLDDGEGTNNIKITLKRNGAVVHELFGGKDSKGQSIEQGHYKFWGDKNNLKIEFEYLNEYVVEFEYNGMLYETVPVELEEETGSKVEETPESRGELTEKYKKITNTTPNDIIYEQPEKYTSKVIYTDAQKASSTGIQAYNTEEYGRDQYHVQATTEEAGLDLHTYYVENGGPEENSLENVNCGIIFREMPDLALTKDIEKASVRIRNHLQVYNYGQRANTEYENVYSQVNIKFDDQSGYANMSYVRPLYKSDIIYDNLEDGLEVYITYKISVKNKATMVYSTVEEFVDYYSKQYEFIAAGKDIDTDGNISSEKYVCEQNGEQYGYKKMLVKTPFDIDAETTESFYMQFKITKTALEDMIKSDSTNGNMDLYNFIEINAYSSRDEEGSDYAGIDENSKPGNMIPGNVNTYEDDTDKAPGMKISLNEAREITGNVFEDLPINRQDKGEAKVEGEERIGNGIKDNDEEFIQIEKVELIPVVEGDERQIVNPVLTYLGYNSSGQPITADAVSEVSTDGSYKFSEFLPGEYIIRFTWKNGDKYTVQKYKSTIYENEFDRENNEYWFLNDVDTRHSDAIDDMTMRKEIDNETSKMTNKVLTSQLKNEMKSYTAKMNVEIEYGTAQEIYWDSEKERYILDSNGNITTDGSNLPQYTEANKQWLHKIKNIDFGIIERPRQELELKKTIKRATLSGTDGTLLIDVEFDDNGVPKLGENTKYMTYVPSSRPSPNQPLGRGLLKAEMDNELMHSATLIILYQFKVSNTSEVDYASDSYYKYGTDKKEADLIHLNPTKIIDYVDDSMQKYTNKTDETRYGNNDNWKILETEQEKRQLLTEGLISMNLEEQLIRNIDKVAIIDNFISGDGLEPIVGKDAQPQKGVHYDTTTLTTSRLLANKQEEVNVVNYSEIITTNRNSTGNSKGSTLDKSTPGNYDISEQNYKTIEPDSSFADEVTIIPPTGANRNIVTYIFLGVLSLVILATGVILIKKKVLP